MNAKTVAVSVVSMLLVGCNPEAMDGPPSIRFGQAECARCGMIVSDARTAGAFVVDAGGRRQDLAFDDIGCMDDYELGSPELRVVSRWIGDYATGQWMPAEHVTLLRSDDLHTPMGSGIIGFAERAAADQKRAEVGGELVTWTQLTVSTLR